MAFSKKGPAPLEIKRRRCLAVARGNLSLSGLAPLEASGRLSGKPLTGFTLIELLVVVLIISITLGLSMPLFRKTFYSIQLSLCAEDMVSYMRYVRERAVVENTLMRFTLDAKGKEYWLSRKDSESGEFIRVKGKYGGYVLSDDVEIESQDSIVDFYPDGTVSSAEIIMSNPNKKRLVISVKQNQSNSIQIIDNEEAE